MDIGCYGVLYFFNEDGIGIFICFFFYLIRGDDNEWEFYFLFFKLLLEVDYFEWLDCIWVELWEEFF